MSNIVLSCPHVRSATIKITIVFSVLLLIQVTTNAAVWNGVEPLKSRRADVERLLGKPIEGQTAETGTLRFKVNGGMVTVLFVDAKFVATKKLLPELEGTVLQVVVQHERATDTPESLGIAKNSDFEREDNRQGVVVYRNLKDGLFYTFVGGQLKTARYSPPAEQLARVQKK